MSHPRLAWPLLFSIASALFGSLSWTWEDWVRVRARPPLSEHDVRCMFGLRSADLVAKLQPDPMHPWEKAPPPLAMKVPLQQLRSAAQEADTHPFNGRVLSRYCGAALLMSMAAAGVLLAGTCPLSFRLENVAAALLSSNAALCFLTSMALSSWCGMRMRPWVSELLYNLTGGEAAIAPHYLEILPGPGAICFALAGTSGFLGALMLGVQEENGRTPTRESEASPKLRSPKIRKDGLVQLVARSRRELVREQQRWADTLLMGCAACFAVLLLASLWVVGQKTVDLGAGSFDSLGSGAAFQTFTNHPQCWRSAAIAVFERFFVKAFVPDTSTIFVDVGLSFRLEMPLAEAAEFLKDKEQHLMKGLELKSKRIARVKADIHEALHLLDLMLQLNDPSRIGPTT
ncbi:unnamed protein product [Effrenium voratum]|uniref:Uncharacterized protein n=1 Tax=Effrenium voratum TaxID=2562239 RepID=A0AA36I410_9DINO|nr:unnamed protein product [Effrenium voratum]